MGFLGARTRPGVELLADTVDLPAAVAGANLVLTGEGSVDAQTLAGKTVAGVTRICADAGVPCVVLAGRVGPGSEGLLDRGATALLPILPEPADLPVALREGPHNLRRATTAALRIFLAGRASG
jgi:glycerate kinase